MYIHYKNEILCAGVELRTRMQHPSQARATRMLDPKYQKNNYIISPLPGPGLGCYQDAKQKIGPDVMPRGQKTRMRTRLTRMPGKTNL